MVKQWKMPKKVKQEHGGTLHQMEPGETLNPNGRPPKTLTGVLKNLKDAGYERVTVAGVVEAYELLMGLDEDAIKKITKDKKEPMIMRIVGKAMLSPRGTDMIKEMMNRAHGKPKQTTDMNVKMEAVDLTGGLKEQIDKYAEPPKPPVRKVVKKPSGNKANRKAVKGGSPKVIRKGKPKA